MRTAGRLIGRPLQGGTEWFCISVGLRWGVARRGRGMPRPYKTKGASHGAPTCLYELLLRTKICLPRVRARRPGAGRGYGVQRIRGTGAGSPDPLALAERAENHSSCCKALNGMIPQLRGHGLRAYTSSGPSGHLLPVAQSSSLALPCQILVSLPASIHSRLRRGAHWPTVGLCE